MRPPTFVSQLQWLARFTSSKAPSRLPKAKPLTKDSSDIATSRFGTESDVCTSKKTPSRKPRFLFSHQLWRKRQQWNRFKGQFDPKHRRILWKCLWLTPYIPIVYVVDRHFVAIMDVTGPSMTPTLNTDFRHDEPNTKDTVLVSLYDAARKVRRGDIIVFRSPKDPERLAIKRIAAVQGDIVQPLSPYPSDPIIIPWGQLWVEGDTEDKSQTVDSNTFGPIPRGLVIGKVLTVLWPLSQIGGFASKEDSRVTKGAVQLRDPDDAITERETYWKALKDKINREKSQAAKVQPHDGEAELEAIKDIEAA